MYKGWSKKCTKCISIYVHLYKWGIYLSLIYMNILLMFWILKMTI